MDKYIKAVLAADGKVIIPRFGCIIEPSEEPGTLSFNPYLNFDDGKLAAAVGAGEGIDTQAAADKIAATVDVYNNSLSDGEAVSIGGLGSFKKGDDGRVEFTQSPDFVHGDGDISLGMGIRADGDMAVKVETGADAHDSDEAKEAEADSGAAAESGESYQPTEERKRKWPLVLLIIILLLIIIWLLLFVFFKDNAVYRYFCGGTPAPTEQTAAAPADTTTVKKDTVAAPAPPAVKKQPAKKAPTEARALERRYNVIVGSYRDEAVAIKRVRELQAKGYTDAFVGIKKDHYVAVIKDFTSLTQAEAYQEKIVDGADHIESWITNSGENDR